MSFLSNVGNSSLGKDISGTLGTAVNLKRMEDDAAITREKMGILRESHGQEMALSKEQIESARLANEQKRKEAEYNNTPVEDFGNHPMLVNNLGPDGAKEFADGLTKHYGKNGVLTREQAAKGISDVFNSSDKLGKVWEMGTKNWTRRIEVDQENAGKAQKKFDSDPSPENFTKLEEAKAKLADSKTGSSNFGRIRTSIDNQMEMKESIAQLEKTDPELFKEISTAPDVITAYNNADTKAFSKAVQDIRSERKALEAARIAAQSRVDVASMRSKEEMTANQKSIREEKSKKELLDNYKADTLGIFRKHKLTAEQREFVEKGTNPANVKGIRPETADKINKELQSAKLRYDDRYEKRFGERPQGSRKFTTQEQSMYNEYKATRDKILKATTKKDGSKVTWQERNAALNSLDEEARSDGLVE